MPVAVRRAHPHAVLLLLHRLAERLSRIVLRLGLGLGLYTAALSLGFDGGGRVTSCTRRKAVLGCNVLSLLSHAALLQHRAISLTEQRRMTFVLL